MPLSTAMSKAEFAGTANDVPAAYVLPRALALEAHAAGAGDDRHHLGRAGGERERAGIDQADRLLRAVGEETVWLTTFPSK